ncbi:MAG: chorismate mutase [Actinomycetota bacterium]|jgi:chorismate mutase|nr:chorismate mutase [Actinomycetota bacterium]
MPEQPSVRALRGATTVEADTVEQVTIRVQELMTELMARNDLLEEDVISIIFTTTADVISTFPATAARGIGFGAVPLLCASEIPVAGATPMCIRVLAHVTTTLARDELRHVYLHGAKSLRDDLPV